MLYGRVWIENPAAWPSWGETIALKLSTLGKGSLHFLGCAPSEYSFWNTESRLRGLVTADSVSNASDFHCSYGYLVYILNKCFLICCLPLGKFPDGSNSHFFFNKFDQLNGCLTGERICQSPHTAIHTGFFLLWIWRLTRGTWNL